MAGENNQNINLSEQAEQKSGGRIFSAAETGGTKFNLDEDIEKNIRIRTMPRKFKISSQTGDNKTTAIGAVIMVVGFLVLGAAVYLAYVFLIKPATPAPKLEVSSPAAVVTPPVTQTPANQAPFTPPAATTTAPVVPTATSTPIVATSTNPVIASSSSPVATSTPAASSTQVLSSEGLPSGAAVVDSDKDGLSEVEEALLGTDPNKADTDGDGFTDGAELLSLYNPAGIGKITDNAHIGVYQDAAAKFSVDYPKIWQVQNLNNGQSIIFSAADNSFVEIISMPDTGSMSIKDWYNSQFPNTPVTDADVIKKNGWQGVFHQTREIFYLIDAAKKNIYTISYVPVNSATPSYYHIFEMMINSFTLK
jgi:hypothetical protein